MHRNRWITVSLIITLLALALPALPGPQRPPVAHAQTGGGSLVFLKDGDLWRWNGSTLTQLSTWGYNERPVLAPDGGRVAYNSWATITVNAIAAGQPVFGLTPSNIWVMDVATGDAERIADQPPDAVFVPDGTSNNVIMRGTPEWSPDGNQVAWVELLAPEYRYRLVRYDFGTRSTSILVENLPYPFADGGFIPVHDVLWGPPGLLITNVAVNPNTNEFEETAHLYAPDGTPIHQAVIGSGATEWTFNKQWVTHNGQQYLGLHYPSGKVYLLDPATGEQLDMPALPELYSRSAPNNMSAYTAPNIDANQNLSPAWTAVSTSRTQDIALDFNGEPQNIAIAPDGQALAYISDAVYIWQNGQASAVPGTGGIASPWDAAVVWGPTAWRVRTDFPGTGGGVVPCNPAPRLTLGAPGQVTPGLPNILRTLPRRGAGSLIVGRIPGNGVFTVLNGPQCGPEGRWWWEVDYRGVVGWTPEGEGSVYWLQPYQAAPPPPACTLPPRLTVGSTAYVVPGLPNTIRSQPGPSSVAIGRIPGNDVFSVLSGPQCGPDGRYWWRVNYRGLTGWTAEGEGATYWVAPFGCPASPPPRLSAGMVARVTPGLPNTLRNGPGASYGEVGTIPAGGTMTVLSGPQCGPEGWSYWRVQYGNQVGWTAEGDGSTYWLEPAGYTPPPTPQPVACTLAPRMMVGVAGRVTPGPDNILRSLPRRGAGSVILGEIPGGAFFTVLEGPQCGPEGRYWWRVNYNGLVGWTPEGEGSTYWLEPWPGDGPPTPACGPAPRLERGISAYVVPGPDNLLRSNPGTGSSSAVIAEIPGGAFFRVLDGPQCGNDGRYWWFVEYQNIRGWTAEGEGADYWVSPFQCANSRPARLVPGGTGRVTPGPANALRTNPGTGTVIGEIPGGAVFQVTGGPQCGSEGRIWWRVTYNGQTGWTAEGQGAEYWLEPTGG